MINREQIYKNIIKTLDDNESEYKLFSHRTALNYQELQEVQKETGFIGTEGKCLAIKTRENFVVCITIQGIKLNLIRLKEILNDGNIRLASPDELKEHFGAEPGCAYLFGFDEKINIYIDPKIYDQKWFLFSPIFPTKTIQIKGYNLRKIFRGLKNKVFENSDIFIKNN